MFVCTCVFAAGYAPTVGVQQSSLTQTQAVMGNYSPMASHQCSMVQVRPEQREKSKVVLRAAQLQELEKLCQEPRSNFISFLSPLQGGISVSYPQNKVVTGVSGGEAGYCCVVPSPSHHSSCHPPSCTNLSAPAWSAQYWQCLSGWSDDTLVPAWIHHTFSFHHIPPPPHLQPPPYSPTPAFWCLQGTSLTHTSMYTHTHIHNIHPLTYINVPLYQSLIVYIRAAVLNA